MKEASSIHKLIHAYNRMMERVKIKLEAFEQADNDVLPNLQRSIEQAAEEAVARGELTQEEARLLSGYLKRDLQDAGYYLATTGEDLRAWLRFDLELIEDRLLELFSAAADKTRLEMLAFQKAAEWASHYHTGEITGPGTLQCDGCGELLHFHATGHIPSCPKCHTTTFSRLATESET